MAFYEKRIDAVGTVEVAGRRVKRYHVDTADAPLDEPVTTAAYRLLPTLLAERDDETPPAAFTVLHRSPSGAYLDVYSWVWGNVVECRVAAAGVPSIGCPDDDPTHFAELPKPWIGCVWELAALEHERGAWVRHLLAPDDPDLPAYLADTLPAGPIGAPR